VPSQGESFASSVLIAAMTDVEPNELNLKSENDPWPVSLFAPQGFSLLFPVSATSEG